MKTTIIYSVLALTAPLLSYGKNILNFLPPHPKVFDIGAHVGSKTSIYLESLNAEWVVCLEPNPELIQRLYNNHGHNKKVTILPIGLAAQPGKIPFFPGKSNPAMSTANPDWKTARFKNDEWWPEIEITVSTLDLLIQQYGIPDFCKIDVEGYELNVLNGLSQKIGYISFEFAYEFLEQKTKPCFQHLFELGYRNFNVALAEDTDLAFEEAQDWETVFSFLINDPNHLSWGDVYAW